MKTMTVAQLEARTSQILTEVAESREPVVITSAGQPLVELVPCAQPSTAPVPGALAHMFVFEQDIVSPIAAQAWEAAR